MDSWRLLPYSIGDPERHVALSDSLVRRSSEPTLWWHSTHLPTLILGAGQRQLDRTVAAAQGVRVVRRTSGGTAVYAGPGVLGQDVFLPTGHPLAGSDVVQAYRWLGEAWLEALLSLRVAARLVSPAEARLAPPLGPDVAMACFGSLSPFEIVVTGRKLVGLAQVRRGNGTLLQAGIHMQFDAMGLAALLPAQQPEVLGRRLAEAAVGLEEAAGRRVNCSHLMETVNAAIARQTDARIVSGTWSPVELDAVSAG